jgi:enoyl-CoA hydratase/carnithine racemase
MPGDAGEEEQQLDAEEHNEEAPHLASIISDEPPSVASPPLYSVQLGGAPMPATLNYLTVRDALPAVVITLNRPEQLNALSTGLMKELTAELDRQSRRQEVRAIVLEGAGRAFSAGHDLKELQGRTLDEEREIFSTCTELMQKIQNVPKPVIAAVHGIATAAGCQLVATCDLAIATEDSRFATSGVRYGLFCSTPGVAVARNVSRKHALDMLLTGRFIDAATAERWGLVNRVVPAGGLDAAVRELVAELAALSPLALEIGKRGFYKQIEVPQAQAYELMSEAIARNAVAKDGQEGISAFVEKRKPNWKGE